MFFKKLFGKKNDGFYLQLEDEDNPSKTAAKAKSQPPAIADKAPAAVTVPVAPAVPAAPAAPVTASKVAPAATSDAKADAKAEKEAEKVAKKAAKKAESAVKAAATKKAEELKATVVATAAVEPAITNFATDYLIKPSSASSRRRPGANMSAFMEMSRQAKKPEAFKK